VIHRITNAFVFGYSAYLTPASAVARNASAKRTMRPDSANVLAKIGELTYSLTKQIASKAEELEKLRGLIKEIKVLHIYLLTLTLHLYLER